MPQQTPLRTESSEPLLARTETLCSLATQSSEYSQQFSMSSEFNPYARAQSMWSPGGPQAIRMSDDVPPIRQTEVSAVYALDLSLEPRPMTEGPETLDSLTKTERKQDGSPNKPVESSTKTAQDTRHPLSRDAATKTRASDSQDRRKALEYSKLSDASDDSGESADEASASQTTGDIVQDEKFGMPLPNGGWYGYTEG